MTKDLKISALILLISLPVFLYSIASIFKNEYPSSFLIQSIEKSPHEYFLSNQSDSFKLMLDLQENVNKSLSVSSTSQFENHKLDLKGVIAFNPLGQLFKGQFNFDIDGTTKLDCNFAGTKPITLTCKKLKVELPIEISFQGPITITKKPNRKYFISTLSYGENPIVQNIVQFLEGTTRVSSTDLNNISLNLDLTKFDLLKTELNKIINDNT